MDALNLTDEMRAEIAKLAERFDVPAEIILRRMVFSYAAKFDNLDQPDATNVVSIFQDRHVDNGESGEN